MIKNRKDLCTQHLFLAFGPVRNVIATLHCRNELFASKPNDQKVFLHVTYRVAKPQHYLVLVLAQKLPRVRSRPQLGASWSCRFNEALDSTTLGFVFLNLRNNIFDFTRNVGWRALANGKRTQ